MVKPKNKWFNPMADFEEVSSKELVLDPKEDLKSFQAEKVSPNNNNLNKNIIFDDDSNWTKNFKPVFVEDLAVHSKKVQEIEEWLQRAYQCNNNDMLLITGPVGCGKTITVEILTQKLNIKLSEWITPLDIEIAAENGGFEYREKQSVKFLDFLLNAANFSSLLDNNSNKIVLVEDFPNIFTKFPSEFTSILQQYKDRARSPIVFICSESHTNTKNSAINLFSPALKEQFNIHHICFNSVSNTNLKSALKRVSDIMQKKYNLLYDIPNQEKIDCVVNSSLGDVRSAVVNLHFACLKGSHQDMETRVLTVDKPQNSKDNKKKKKAISKFTSMGRDHTVSILHGVGRVLNPKFDDDGNLTRLPSDLIEQFLSQPGSFVNFIGENYLTHFTSIADLSCAATALSEADYLLSEWDNRYCQEYGLFVAVAGVMLANKTPFSSWNPVRGPKYLKITYPSTSEIPLLEENVLVNGKILSTDYKTYCNIINKN